MKKTVKNLITWSPSHLITSQKSAFTLAEVLITLAIIGIVAAMTIPTLMQSYKKKVVEVKLQKFYAMINEAVRLSEIDNGDAGSWDFLDAFCSFNDENETSTRPQCKSGTEDALIWYNKYLAPYIKAIKVETAQDKTYCAGVGDDVLCKNPSDVILYFADGSAFQFSGRGMNYYIDANQMISDGRPEKWGINGFPFQFFPQEHIHIQPYSGGTPTPPECTPEGSGAYCTYAIWQNNWKIPENYPHKF